MDCGAGHLLEDLGCVINKSVQINSETKVITKTICRPTCRLKCENPRIDSLKI